MSTFSVGQLIDIEWRLGVAVKSSDCKALNSPFVSVLMRVQDSDKKIAQHTFELTLAEFQEFSKKFHDIGNLMESLS